MRHELSVLRNTTPDTPPRNAAAHSARVEYRDRRRTSARVNRGEEKSVAEGTAGKGAYESGTCL